MMRLIRRLSLALLLQISLTACAVLDDTKRDISNFIADTTPKFMGGLPAGVPPRPSDPRYRAFEGELSGRGQKDGRSEGKVEAGNEKQSEPELK
jgi:hypothetical protein